MAHAKRHVEAATTVTKAASAAAAAMAEAVVEAATAATKAASVAAAATAELVVEAMAALVTATKKLCFCVNQQDHAINSHMLQTADRIGCWHGVGVRVGLGIGFGSSGDLVEISTEFALRSVCIFAI